MPFHAGPEVRPNTQLRGALAIVGTRNSARTHFAITTMHSKTPPHNRLAKVLPESWREFLVAHGVPKRKYTAVCRATLLDGTVFEDLIIEQGWIVAIDRAGLAGTYEQRIPFDPRKIETLEIVQVV